MEVRFTIAWAGYFELARKGETRFKARVLPAKIYRTSGQRLIRRE
jgi:hypothetical protein